MMVDLTQEMAQLWASLRPASPVHAPAPQVIDNFLIDDWLRRKINASVEELVKEKECVGHLIGTANPVCRITDKDEDTWLPGEN